MFLRENFKKASKTMNEELETISQTFLGLPAAPLYAMNIYRSNKGEGELISGSFITSTFSLSIIKKRHDSTSACCDEPVPNCNFAAGTVLHFCSFHVLQ